MRVIRFGALGIALLAFGAAIAPAQTSDDFFNDRVVQELRLVMRPADWANLKLHYDLNTYYPADLHWIYNGRDILVGNIGVRSRGRGSRSPIKPGLRLDFNRYEPNQQFLALGSLVLKPNNQDGSMLREQTVFKLWDRTGLPASRESFTRLYVNDTYVGVNLLVEEIRDSYTERYLNEKGGDLYKFNPISEGFHFEWIPTCATALQIACSTDTARWSTEPFDPEENKNTFDVKTTIDWIRLTNTVSDTDFERTISSYVDFKYLASYVAVENYTADADSFLGDVFGMNNFFLYRYKGTTLHQLLVWDKDFSYDWSGRPVFWGADKNVLMRRTLAIPAYRTRYLESAYITAMLAGGPGGWMEWEHQREYDLGKQAIYEDPIKLYSVAGVVMSSSNEIFEQEVAKNRKFLNERTAFALREIAANGWQPSSAVSVSQGGVVNAAGSSTPAAPGSYISIYGSGFTQTTTQATSVPFPTTLGGVTVIINGFFAPIHFVSPNQINVQVPWELGMGDGTAPVSVLVNGAQMKVTRANSPINATISNAVITSVGPFAPGVFAVTQADGSLTTAKPAGAGDVLVIYANGLGPLREAVATGSPAPIDHLVFTTETPFVMIGGVPAEVQFSGLAPGFVGAYQLNVKVPAGVRAGSVPLMVSVGGQTASSTISTR